MRPNEAPPFEYVRALTLDNGLEALARHSDAAKILAGGQSLVPMMNFRMAAPKFLIDINRLDELETIEITPTGLALGALVRGSILESSPLIGQHNPLLREAVRHIAHFQIRNRGTVGGSSAHADPAAEFPAVALTCDATFTLRRLRGTRTLPAAEFFLGALDTALMPDEILTCIRFPPWPENRRWGFEEFSRHAGDFDLAGVAVTLDFENSDVCQAASMVCFGISDRAKRLGRAEAVLRGRKPSHDLLEKAARIAADDSEAASDMHAPADYRHALLETLMLRALCSAASIVRSEAA